MRIWERARTPLTILAVVAIALLLVGRGVDPLEAGVRAPDLEVETSEGTVRLAQSGVTVVNFWGTYCPPCRAEAPVLSRAHERLRREGGRVVGLSTDRSSLADVTQSARQLGMRYPVAVASADVLDRYRVDRLPTTYVVSPSGRITASFVGAVSDAALERAVRAAR